MPEPLQTYRLQKTIFLVGFMGAGKTSLARKLARRYGVASIDLDAYIVRSQGMSIKEIFALHGEEGFRAIEAQSLKEVAALGPSFVSCGGGTILRSENRAFMRDTGYVVHLHVAPEEAMGRISNHANRPLLANKEKAVLLAHERDDLYRGVAHLTVDTTGKQSYEVACWVGALLEKEGIVCRQEK